MDKMIKVSGKPSVKITVVPILLHTQFESNLGDPDWRFSWFSSVPQVEGWTTITHNMIPSIFPIYDDAIIIHLMLHHLGNWLFLFHDSKKGKR
jgi:hypothetical protein